MKQARNAAVVTWVYVGAFGVPTVPVAAYLVQRGTLPTFFDLFEMYGGPWSSRLESSTIVWLLVAFAIVTFFAAWGAWLMWNGRRAGGVASLLLLPIEAVFWLGFALPFPWLLGVARAALVLASWKALR